MYNDKGATICYHKDIHKPQTDECKEANLFAEELLMPTDVFIEKWKEYKGAVFTLNLVFNVSAKMVAVKVARLHREGYKLEPDVPDSFIELFDNDKSI